jgi:hypothetical protein
MLAYKLKQTETALNQGLLKEAYEYCQDGQIREHWYGRLLMGQLSRNLFRRSNEYLQAGRLQQALNYCDMSEELNGNLIWCRQR